MFICAAIFILQEASYFNSHQFYSANALLLRRKKNLQEVSQKYNGFVYHNRVKEKQSPRAKKPTIPWIKNSTKEFTTVPGFLF